MAKYYHQNLVDLIGLCVRHIDGELTYTETEARAKVVVPLYPSKRLKQEINRFKNILEGRGSYGFRYPANWFKAIFEVTNNSENAVKAAKEQQSAYLEKDGKVNKRLDLLLDSLN